MYRSYGTQKKFVHFLGGLKSAATILTEPTALLVAENLWVMDSVSTSWKVYDCSKHP